MARTWTRLIGMTAVVAVSAACHSPSSYEPRSVTNPNGLDPDEVLQVSASPASLPADGISRTRITARLDPAATVRGVAFTTSLGTLFGNGQSAAATTGSLSMTADDAGIATVELQSSADVATARVTATVALPADSAGAARSFVRTIDVNFVPVVADQLFTLQSSHASLPADGFSTATITASLTVSGNLQQDVVFSTSRGTLVKFGAAPEDTGTTVRADATGLARIQLRSDGTVGTARVSARVLGYEREVFVVFGAVTPAEIITVDADDGHLPADGATRTRIVARVSPDLPEAERTVTFTTTDGTFTDRTVAGSGDKSATVKADASNTAIVEIKSPLVPATATITATAGNVTARTDITYSKAQPNTVFVKSDDGAVTAAGSDDIQITVYLLRNVGQVANNTVVTFEARDKNGKVIGTFSSVTLAEVDSADESEFKRLVSTAAFNPDDTAALGTATITARAGGVSGTVKVLLE